MNCENNNLDYLYTDITLSLNDKNNDIYLSSGIEAINNSINNILTIRENEVPSAPTKFMDLYAYLHEFFDEITFEAMRIEIKDALFRFEKRIEVIDIAIVEEISEQYLTITVFYKIRSINSDEVFNTNVNIGEF